MLVHGQFRAAPMPIFVADFGPISHCLKAFTFATTQAYGTSI